MKNKTSYKRLMEISEAPLDSPSQLPFSSIEARRLAEKDVMKIGKIIGKASAQAIRVMMDGVKAGGYDALDLQRAIMSGPAKRAGTGQIELMRTLWNRVRDGFRRYMKRGKLRN
tara:strand:+ start:320 stop:661 length:342 start_codon:yes stop_codon:yes gene_type:complete